MQAQIIFLVPRQLGNQPRSKACKSFDLQAFSFFVNQFDLNNFNENVTEK
jgi:hypothetical protein